MIDLKERTIRTAERGCPMCGSTSEDTVKVEFEDSICYVTFKCNKCGVQYVTYYICTYDGFSMGDVAWNAEGNLDFYDEK